VIGLFCFATAVSVTLEFPPWICGVKYIIKPRATCGQSSELLTQFLPVPTEFHHILETYIKFAGSSVTFVRVMSG